MMIISAGFMKSASTLIRDYQIEMINLASKRNGQKMLEKFSSGRGAAYRGQLNLKMFLLLMTINLLYGDIALKTHLGPTFFVRLLVILGLVKVTYSYRSPRDVGLSMLDHGDRSRQRESDVPGEKRGFGDVYKVSDAIPKVKQEIKNWCGWQTFGDALLIRYEDFMTDKATSLKKILEYLCYGYELNSADFDTLLHKYETVKSRNFNKGTIERCKAEIDGSGLAECNQALEKELNDMQCVA